MLAGRLRHRIIFQQMVETRDSAGAVIETWSEFKTAWASIEPLVGKEFFDSKQVNAEISIKIRIRAISGLTTKMRILYGTRVFEIFSIANVREMGSEMVLMCREDV